MKGQRGQLHLTSALIVFAVNLSIAVGGGVAGAAAMYYGVRQDIAIIYTKLEYISDAVKEIKSALKRDGT